MYASGFKDVDVCLTTRELARMLKQSGVDFLNLPDGEGALEYSRARYTSVVTESTDFARSVRQARVMGALEGRVTVPGGAPRGRVHARVVRDAVGGAARPRRAGPDP